MTDEKKTTEQTGQDDQGTSPDEASKTTNTSGPAAAATAVGQPFVPQPKTRPSPGCNCEICVALRRSQEEQTERKISTEIKEDHDLDNDDASPDLENALSAANSTPIYTIFSIHQRRFILFMTAWGGFFSGVSSNIYYPALNDVSQDFHVSSTLINLTVTSYMIFQGLAPTFIGDLADIVGRRPAYVVCFTIYIGANIGLALCQNYASLFILRAVQASGSSATVALGIGRSFNVVHAVV